MGIPKPGGRAEGSRNKKTAALIAGAADAGLMPLDYMLQRMRDPDVPHQERGDMAKAAAPYLHARLAPRADEFDDKPVGGEIPEYLEFEKRLARYEANIIAGRFGNGPKPE